MPTNALPRWWPSPIQRARVCSAHAGCERAGRAARYDDVVQLVIVINPTVTAVAAPGTMQPGGTTLYPPAPVALDNFAKNLNRSRVTLGAINAGGSLSADEREIQTDRPLARQRASLLVVPRAPVFGDPGRRYTDEFRMHNQRLAEAAARFAHLPARSLRWIHRVIRCAAVLVSCAGGNMLMHVFLQRGVLEKDSRRCDR